MNCHVTIVVIQVYRSIMQFVYAIVMKSGFLYSASVGRTPFNVRMQNCSLAINFPHIWTVVRQNAECRFCLLSRPPSAVIRRRRLFVRSSFVVHHKVSDSNQIVQMYPYRPILQPHRIRRHELKLSRKRRKCRRRLLRMEFSENLLSEEPKIVHAYRAQLAPQTSLAASGQLQKAIKYCTKLRKRVRPAESNNSATV